MYGIAVNSPTFGSLLWHVNHEGHPLIWYLLIWLFVKVFPSVLVMKVVQGIVGACIIAMVALAEPFTRLERVLLLLSYFLIFEYTIMTRLYGVCVLLAIAFLWRRVHRPDSFFWNTLVLGLMANTDTLGLFFSGAFGLEWIANRYRERPDKPLFLRQVSGAAAIYVAMLVFCYVTIRPPYDMSWRTTGRIFRHGFDLNHLTSILAEYLALPWAPIRFHSFVFPGHYWNPISFEHPRYYGLLLFFVVVAYLLTFWRDRDLLATFALASLGAAAFGFVVFTGNMRNWGITFVAYVGALWLQRFRRSDVPRASTVLLCMSAISGVIFSALMWTEPFGNAQATAHWIQSHHYQYAALVGTPDTSAAGIAVLLNRPIYFLDCRCSDSYTLFSSRRDDFDQSDIPRYTIQAFDKLHSQQLILLLVRPMEPEEKLAIEKSGAEVQLMADFTGSEAFEEDYFIYKLTSKVS